MAVGPVQRFRLLEWSQLLVRDEEFEIAAIVVGEYEHLVPGRLKRAHLDLFEPFLVNSHCLCDFAERALELITVPLEFIA
ncbi:hypothetical protein D9M71_302340 [compost metagenome]